MGRIRKLTQKQIDFALELYFKHRVCIQDITDIISVNYNTLYPYIIARKGHFKSPNTLRNKQARVKGYGSHYKYELARKVTRQEYPRNKDLASKITAFLEQIGKSEYWLARETGLSRQLISVYIKGTHYPSPVNLDKVTTFIDNFSSTI